MSIGQLLFIALFAGFVLISCGSLKPVSRQGTVMRLHYDDLARFNGAYSLVSTDTSYPTLAAAMTFSDRKDISEVEWIRKNGCRDCFVRLHAKDPSRLEVSIYKEQKRVKRKVVRGHIEDDYFHFRMTKLAPARPFYGLLNVIRRQKNRIALLPSGDIMLDSYGGGILLLVIFPTFGGDSDTYGMVFQRVRKVGM
jgi:hypothetical protein